MFNFRPLSTLKSVGTKVCTLARRSRGTLLAAAAVVGMGGAASGQTISPAPAAQSLPYITTFGTANFTSPPAGWAVLAPASAPATQTAAESSSPSGTPVSLSAATPTNGGTGGGYGYAVSGDARLGILQSGASSVQPVLALNTTGATNIVLRYDLINAMANLRTIGVVAQYRLTNSGAWTTLPSVTGNPYTQSGGTAGTVTPVTVFLPTACENQALVQLRWTTWRGSEAGNSSGVAIDNVTVGTPANINVDAVGTVGTVNGTIGSSEYGPGNTYARSGGGTGFGGSLGNGTVYFASDTSGLNIAFQPGAALGGNDTVVLFLNTRRGGVAVPRALSSGITTSDRRSIARILNSASLPAGFDADFAVAFNNADIYFYEIVPPGLTDLSGSTTRFNNSGAGIREIRIPYSVIGTFAAGGNIDYFAGLTNGNDPTFMANESIPAMSGLNGASSPGTSGGAFSAFNRFTTFSCTNVSISGTAGSQTICEGANQSYTANATGTGTLTYQWRLNGNPLSNGGVYTGVNTATLTITGATPANSGVYTCLVSNACPSSSTSQPQTLTVNPATVISTQPSGATVCFGLPVSFSVTATGTGTLTYQWRRNGSDILGATASSYSIASVTLADSGTYDVLVTGGCGTATSAGAFLNVQPPTVIGTGPVSQTVCQGTNASFSVAATGLALTYQWRKDGNPLSNGGNILGATSAALSITGVGAGDAASYDVQVTGTCGTTQTSSAATLTVNPTTAINTQPTSQTACAGTGVTFSVGAVGASLSYQWEKDGNPIGGATSATYTIASLVVGDQGDYTVVVTGACGTPIESSVATLTVNASTAIGTQPASQTVCAGTPVTLSVTATGAGLTYQWKKGGTDISGETGSSYTIASAVVGDSGNFTVEVIGTCGTVLSSVATLTVNPTTAIGTQPVSQTVCAGTPVTLSVTATGAGLTYQWKKGGTDISGETGPSYTIASAVVGDSGNYTVEVIGTCGTVLSSVATLTVNQTPVITSEPGSATEVCEGTPITYTVAATGGGLSYQWRKGGNNILGATSASFMIPSATLADAGVYDCVVTNTCGTATTNPTTLTVKAATAIGTPPSGATVCEGQPVTFSVGATGANLSFQWRRNTVAIGGATASTFTIAAATLANAGTYDVVVVGDCGTVTSIGATLNVNALAVAPTGASVDAPAICTLGGPATVTLTATGGSGDTLTWFSGSCGGTVVGTGPVLTIPAPGATTTYFARWTTVCGDSACVNATVTVQPAPTVAAGPSPTGSACAASPNVTLSGTAFNTASVLWTTSGDGVFSFPAAAAGVYTLGAGDIALGTVTLTLTGQPIGPCVGAVTSTLTLTIAPSPTTARVDDDYAGLPAGTSVNFPYTGTGPYTIGCDAFATIQAGVNAVTNSTVLVAPGTYVEDVLITLNGLKLISTGGPSVTTIRGVKGGPRAVTVSIAANNVEVAGFTITREGNTVGEWNDNTLNSAGIAIQGSPTAALIRDNLITGNRTGIDINNSGGHTVRNNVIDNNRSGMLLRNTTNGVVIRENAITNNWTMGVLFLDGSGGTNVPAQSADGLMSNNTISGNWWAQVEDRQSGGSVPTPGTTNLKSFSGNWLGTTTPIIKTINGGEPGYAGQIPVAFGGTAVAPATSDPNYADIKGLAVANFDYTPMLTVGTDTDINLGGGTYGFQGDATQYTVASQLAQVGTTGRIQEGHDAVALGGTVTVQAGTFTENVAVSKRVVIDGAGASDCDTAANPATETVVTSAAANQPVFDVNDAGGLSASQRLTLRDMRITGASGSNDDPAAGVRVLPATGQTREFFRFENLVLTGNQGPGVAVRGAGGTANSIEIDSSDVCGAYRGVVVYDDLAGLNGLSITGSTIKNNSFNGLSVNGNSSGTFVPTGITVANSNFSNNGQSNNLFQGSGDLSFFLFNGDATLSNVNIATTGRLPIQFRGRGTGSPGTWAPMGTVSLNGVTVTGSADRAAITVQLYSNVNNLSLNNVDLSGVTNLNGPGTGFSVTGLQLAHAGTTALALGNTIFPCQGVGYAAVALGSTGGASADCTTVFTGASTLAQKEACVADVNDFPGLGDITFLDAGITTNPTPQTVCEGAPVTFSVVAANATGFQWRKDGNNILGATSASYTIAAATIADAGSYDVVVTGVCGPVTSAAASLTVNALTTIVTAPVGGTFCAGDNVSLAVGATGSGLSYTWRRNTVALSNSGSISGQGTASLSITGAGVGDTGSYDVVVAGLCGTLTTIPVTVTVNPTTVIVSNPTGASLCQGSPFTATVNATGSSLTYQWRKDGNPILGANASTFAIASVTPADAGSYDVVVTGDCGILTSSAAVLAVQAAATVSAGGPAVTVCSTTTSITLNGTGSGTASVLWTTNGSGAFSNASSLTGTYTFSPADITAGTVMLTLTGNPVAPCTTPAVSTLVISITPPPAVVYVDDDYSTLPNGTAVNFPFNGLPGGPYTIGCDAFAGVQAAIAAVTSGGTVNVDAGNYVGVLAVNKPVTLLGANAGVCASSPRGPESVLRPLTSQALDGILLYVTASNVTIDGFTLEGDNGIIGDGQLAFESGTRADVGNIVSNGSFDNTTLYPFVPVDDVDVKNNRIRSANDIAVNLYNISGTGQISDGNEIVCNAFTNMGGQNTLSIPGDPLNRIAVLLYNDTYANVDNNVLGTDLSPVNIGVQTGNNYQPAANPANATISGNTARAQRVGIFHNLHYANASPWTISGNNVFGPFSGPPATDGVGIVLWSLSGTSTATVSSNSIGNFPGTSSSGYEIWNVDPTTPVSISGGIVSFTAVGVYATNWTTSYGSGKTVASISGLTVAHSSGTANIHAFDQPDTVPPATFNPSSPPPTQDVRLNITGGTSYSTTRGVKVEGSKAGAVVDGLNVYSTTVGAIEVVEGAAVVRNSNLSVGNANGVLVYLGAKVDLGQCGPTATDLVGLGTGSLGNNDLSGYGFDGAAPFAIFNTNSNVEPDVTAANNTFGGGPLDDLNLVISGNGGANSDVLARQIGGAPGIVTQPAPATVCVGGTATLTVVAVNGTSFQWRKDGVDIGGATSASYTINPAALADADSYDVVITDVCGTTTTSISVSLTVNALTTISVNPVSQTVCEGAPVTFSVTAANATGFQWRKGGVDILGATASSYTIAAAGIADAGSYDVVVSGLCGPVTSSAASLTVNALTVINTPPVGGTFCVGSPITLSVGASGTGLTYQWRKNTVAILGANGPSLSIPSAAVADTGSYDVVVSGACGTVTSLAVSVTVNPTTVIVTNPVGANLCAGSTFTATVNATGAGLTYQWRKDATPILGANAPTFTIAVVSVLDAGTYDVVVTGACGTLTSAGAVLAVQATPTTAVGGPYSTCSGVPVQLTGVAANVSGVVWTTSGDGAFSNANILNPVYTPGPNDNLGATIFISLTGTAVAPCVNPFTSVAPLTISPPPAVAFVDDGYVGLPIGTSVNFPFNGAPGPHTIGCNAFATIQGAATQIAPGGTVNVADGTYAESVVVGKPMALKGPNAGTCAKSTLLLPRVAEAIVRPGASNALDGILIYVKASNVTIDGFTLSGDNGTVGDGQPAPGGEADTGNIVANGSFDNTGPYPFIHVKNVSVINNIIGRANDIAVNLYNDGSQPVSDGNAISCNRVADISGQNVISPGGPYNRIGVLLYNDTYANVDDNSFTNFNIGVQTGNNFRPNAGPAASISNNDMTGFQRLAIWHNLHYANASAWTINTNLVSPSNVGPVANAFGIFISSIQTAVATSATNNTISNCDSGILLWNNPTTTTVQINGGNISGCNVGVDFVNNDAIYTDGVDSRAILFGMTLNGNVTGVRLLDTPGDDPINPAVRGTLRIDASNMTVVGSSNVGFLVDGARASLNLVGPGTLVNGNGVGVEADGGKARVQGVNLMGNTSAAIGVSGGAIVDAGQCAPGVDVTGLGVSTGGNNLSGYGFDSSAPWAVVNLNAAVDADVLAQNNMFGAGPGDNIALAILGNGGANSDVLFSQAGGPVITTAPVATSVCAGSNASLSVTAFGQFTYQWLFNGNPILGATSATLSFTPATIVNAGSYEVVVSDACGASVTTTAVSLTVNVAPVVTLDPLNLSTCPGGSVTFSVAATGSPAPTFQWLLDGNPILGATSPSYTISSAVPGDVGVYTVQVTNICGTVFSGSGSLSLLPVPVAAASATVDSPAYCSTSAPATITLGAIGGSGSTFTWFDSSCGTGPVGTGPSITIPAPGATTTYFGRWSTSCGESTCVSVTVTVTTTPTAPTLAASDTPSYCSGAVPATVTLTATGGSGGTVRWYSGSCGTTLVGSGSPLTIAAPTSTTTYFARREDGSCFSGCVSTTVTVNASPVAPTLASVDSPVFCSGSVPTITLTATGGSGDSLVWYAGSCGSSPVGSGAVLTIPAPLTSTTYFARWESTLCGNTACASVSVTVNATPVAPIAITTSSSGYCPGSIPTITLTAIGGSGVNVQWFTGSCGSTVIATGVSVTIPAPVTTTTYFARWTSAFCGESTCATLSVPVAPITGVCCVGFGLGKTCTIVTQPGGCAGPTTPAQAYRGNCSVCSGPGQICCPSDFNNDGVRNPTDIFDFLSAYFAASPFADFNNDSVRNPTDIFNLLTSYFQGCN
jgi:hypothetical protein